MRRLSRANRWLLAGSVALTAVFAEVAANAFPGKTIKTSSPTGSRSRSGRSNSSGSSSTVKSLQAPAQAPQESAPATPAHESAPVKESAPAQEAPAPVVSGGS